ncbi:MAG: 3-deoxy-manno-octulosonate cytidylyltransferase [Candidatus Zixiibacteriota bacterium]
MPAVIGVIPARLNSQRFPAKALAPLSGKPLLYYIWRRALRAKSLDCLVIATDSKRIARVAEDFGANVILTTNRPRNGSERTAEVACSITGGYFVNIQGDNLVFSPGWIDTGVRALKSNRTRKFHTLVTAIRSSGEMENHSRVKVAVLGAGPGRRAGWFSRSPLPCVKPNKISEDWRRFRCYKHIGVYFYRRSGLELYQSWKPGRYEKAESLEQLRILEHGESIGVSVVSGASIVIDSERDLKNATRFAKLR